MVLAVHLCAATPLCAETHTVRLYDFYYEPKDITITQGDTVRYVWVDAFHDAVAGNPPGLAALPYQEVFNTGLDDQIPFVKEVVFSRDMLVNSPAPNNRYDYYCTPHFTSGMSGSVTVQRLAQQFSATARAWQMVPPNTSEATASCSATLNGEETEVEVTCEHTVSDATSAALYVGFLGEATQKVCDLSLNGDISGACTLTQDQANMLYDGRYSVIVHSTTYPEGEIRGQLTRVSQNRTVSGEVLLLNGSPLQGARISDGTRSAITGSDGRYTLTGVPSGAYQLRATRSDYLIVADEGVSPLLVNANNASNRNFTAVLGAPRAGDRDGDGVSDILEQNDGTNPDDSGSYKTHLQTPIRALWNGFIDLINIAAIINKSDQSFNVTIKLHDILGNVVHQEARAIAANGETDIILNDLPGFTPNSFGLFSVEFDESLNGSVDGQMFYYRFEENLRDYEFAFGVPFSPPSYGRSAVAFNTFNPSQDPSEAGNLVAQWLSIVNLDQSSAQSFLVKKYDQAGTLLSTTAVDVPPFGRMDLEGGHVNPGPNSVGLNVIEPQNLETPYIAQLYRYGGNAGPGASPTAYSFAFPLLSRAGSGELLAAPTSTGGGAENWIEVVNTLSVEVDAELIFYNQAGEALGNRELRLLPYEQQHFNAGALLGAGASGIVRLIPETRGSLLGTSMFYFRDALSGRITSMYGSPLQEAIGKTTEGSYNLFLGAANWLKLLNTSSETTVATVSVFAPGGVGEENVRMIELPAFSSTQLGLHEPQYGTSADTFGVLRVTSERPAFVLSEVLRLRAAPNGSVDFAAPTPVR